ncbi:MAG: hypothetical protein DME33_15605 [Verrucomicrobia bacterium]|nr:MAG: hypothetical protein DME33_15605 [Verrucomicrobiota bacterium]
MLVFHSGLAVIPSEVEESRRITLRQGQGILRIRFAALRMTREIILTQRRASCRCARSPIALLVTINDD